MIVPNLKFSDVIATSNLTDDRAGSEGEEGNLTENGFGEMVRLRTKRFIVVRN